MEHHQQCECKNAAALACYTKANGGCPKPKYNVSGYCESLRVPANIVIHRNAKYGIGADETLAKKVYVRAQSYSDNLESSTTRRFPTCMRENIEDEIHMYHLAVSGSL
jgi:hypothetical protein